MTFKHLCLFKIIEFVNDEFERIVRFAIDASPSLSLDELIIIVIAD